MKIYYDKDADLQLIRGKKVAVTLRQPRPCAFAQSQSGASVVVGLREGSSWKEPGRKGLEGHRWLMPSKASDVIMILAPDEAQAAIYRQDVTPNLEARLLSGIRSWIQYPLPAIVAAGRQRVYGRAQGAWPSSPGDGQSGVPCLLAVHQDPSGNTRQVRLGLCKARWAADGPASSRRNFRERRNGFIWRAGGLVRRLTSLIRLGSRHWSRPGTRRKWPTSVFARSEVDRGFDLPGRHCQHAVFNQHDGEVRATLPWPARGDRRDQAGK